MKQKNEADLLSLIHQIQAQITALDRKVDALISRSSPPPKPVQAPQVSHHHKERTMYKAICADCEKECTIPFKPSGDRPVYCQDCFSKRKMVSMSKIGLNKPKEEEVITAEPKIKAKKKATASKKPAAKKKSAKKK